MLGWFADEADPDAGLLAFRRVSEELGTTHWYLKMLRDEGRAAERLAHVLGRSRYAADLLVRSPESVAILGDAGRADPARRGAALHGHDAPRRRRRGVRGRRHGGGARRPPPRAAPDRHRRPRPASSTSPASARPSPTSPRPPSTSALDIAVREVEEQAGRRSAPGLLVVGMGSLGGAEMGYASRRRRDLRAPSRPGEAPTSEAQRPGDRSSSRRCAGCSAPPARTRSSAWTPTCVPRARPARWCAACSPTATYYERWALTWEFQALLRAAPVAGDAGAGPGVHGAHRPAAVARGRADAAQVREIRLLKARVEAERLPRGGDPQTHLKLGLGGLTDVEWTVQLLQLRHAAADSGAAHHLAPWPGSTRPRRPACSRRRRRRASAPAGRWRRRCATPPCCGGDGPVESVPSRPARRRRHRPDHRPAARCAVRPSRRTTSGWPAAPGPPTCRTSTKRARTGNVEPAATRRVPGHGTNQTSMPPFSQVFAVRGYLALFIAASPVHVGRLHRAADHRRRRLRAHRVAPRHRHDAGRQPGPLDLRAQPARARRRPLPVQVRAHRRPRQPRRHGARADLGRRRSRLRCAALLVAAVRARDRSAGRRPPMLVLITDLFEDRRVFLRAMGLSASRSRPTRPSASALGGIIVLRPRGRQRAVARLRDLRHLAPWSSPWSSRPARCPATPSAGLVRLLRRPRRRRAYLARHRVLRRLLGLSLVAASASRRPRRSPFPMRPARRAGSAGC